MSDLEEFLEWVGKAGAFALAALAAFGLWLWLFT
jgi:hypothetical protein